MYRLAEGSHVLPKNTWLT